MPYEIEVDELKRALDAGEDWVLVDVREGWEHALVHIPGAVHIPLGQLVQRLGELQQERPHVLYCHHGMRSMRAALALAQRGFANVRSLRGGIDRWAEVVDPTLARY
ncbi:MAG TPA: rhodanese-like domain-containing protein [Candidatus Krumholzibacteria bacterium]|jgi:sulfur-carrier protein adenylyltransferase/sulfurtransferase|nr:rhodanese-like domain-containing protein [Candidatus Krumholzibacteria bacterium]